MNKVLIIAILLLSGAAWNAGCVQNTGSMDTNSPEEIHADSTADDSGATIAAVFTETEIGDTEGGSKEEGGTGEPENSNPMIQGIKSPSKTFLKIPDNHVGTPTLGETCEAQSKVVGTDNAGVITIGTASPENSWNLGCTIYFSKNFEVPVCVISVSEGMNDNRVKISQIMPDSLTFASTPYKFQGGEKVMYICTEAGH